MVGENESSPRLSEGEDIKTDEQMPSFPPPPSNRMYPGAINYNACPTCGKPAYPYPYPYQGPPKTKKFLGLPVWAWVIILIVTLVVSCSIVGMISFWSLAPEDTTETYSTEVIISEGGHFKYTLGFAWEDDEISLDISSLDGKKFDVYIMDMDQYENAYETQNASIIAFSAVYSKENVDTVADTAVLPDEGSGFREYFLVIDNKDTALTPDDAVPDGAITIDVNITLKTVYPLFMD
ncbi:MAG: hypothetical protein JSV56_09795 [Methanomassiliicoccales archaeon]|nr:MAG: hypothetical protein JSV56_09795 [Methanomassiliicoccales archaeon]